MEFNIFGREIYLRKEIIIVLLALLVFILGGIGYVIKAKGGEVIVSRETGDSAEIVQEHEGTTGTKFAETKDEIVEDRKTEQIKVYVVGCVKNAGVVTLEKGQIIDDAIRAAGGATKDADLESINLAYELNENTMIKVLSKKESQSAQQDTERLAKTQDGGSTQGMKGVKIIKDSGGAIVSNSTEKQESGKKGKININTASSSELDTLPGVGEKTAADIIAYREKNGSFKKIEDIMNVPRIGESRFQQMKELITVQ